MTVIRKAMQAAAGAVGDPLYVEDVFSTFLYEGRSDASGLRTIDNGINLADEGGLVWTRERNNAAEHLLIDTERGLSGGYLATDDTAAASTSRIDESIDSFTTTGYKLDGDGTLWDRGTYKYVSWSFRKAEKFFDVVTYTGNGTAGRTIAHNLGSTPGMLIVKKTSASGLWPTLHKDANIMHLNGTYAAGTAGTTAAYFGDGASVVRPTDSVFTVGAVDNVNTSGQTYVAYLFASDAGGYGDDSDENIVKCGSYTADSSNAYPVTLGFEPQFVLVKRTDSTGNWQMLDTMRGFSADPAGQEILYSNVTNAETNDHGAYITSTGFVASNQSASNGATYIYMAIRRPMKTPTAGTEVFAVETIGATNGGSLPSYVSGFPVDMLIQAKRDVDNNALMTRLLGETRLFTNLTNAESSETEADFDYQDGAFSNTSVETDRVGYMFKRATGFFDVVAYSGSGSATTQAHNLGVVPEMIWVKGRVRSNTGWAVYNKTIGNTKRLELDSAGGSATATPWNNTTPTDSTFTISDDLAVNGGSPDTYIACLFATLAGVSKVGSYTGTAASLDLDMGFAAGARFFMCKRTDAGGSWYMYDTARGIVAGDDPYLLLEDTAAEVTNTDYIDPLASGLTLTAAGSATINVSGGTYIYLAIA
jgi:hypothetical protein